MTFDPLKYRAAFFDEAAGHLADLEAALFRLDAGARDPDAVAAAFRAAHSVKGGADAVGLPDVARFTHALEDFLDPHRDSPAPVPRAAVDLLFQASDALAGLIHAARAGAAPPPGADDLAARLRRGVEAPPPPAPPPARYAVIVTPKPDAFTSGLDPLRLVRELETLGEVARVVPNLDALPPLADMDPDRCYVSWAVGLTTGRPKADIEDVFAFAADHLKAVVHAATAPTPPLAAAAPAAPAPEPDPVRFGLFLARRGAVPADRVLEALNRQREGRPMLGALAVETGRMAVDAMFTVQGRMNPGDPFGPTAVRMGYLTDSGVGSLLMEQERRTPPLGACLVEAGFITPAKLDAELAAFHDDAHASPAGASLYSEVIEPDAPPPPRGSILVQNGEMVGEFCAEACEHLEAADKHLLVIDSDPTDRPALDAIYRGFHTIKGVSSMLELEAIRTLAHEAENLLNLAREGKLTLRGDALDLAFASVDALKRQIAILRGWLTDRGPLDPDPLLPPLLADLQAVSAGKPRRGAAPPPAKPAAAAPEAEPAAAKPAAPPADKPAAAPHAGPEKETVRVDRHRLDKLINTIGELVIAQSMAQQEYDDLAGPAGALSRALPELSKISRDLQELSLGLRMVPLQGTFQKMARLVRDLSRKMDKPVELDLHGEETELDKTVVDQLGDPLLHMVRNAIDHGLEDPAGRAAAGKPAAGRVTLKAYHQGGSVYLELADDGKGMDKDRIFRKAVEKGLVAESARLTDAEIYGLIFAPGFSTAAAVTDVSGRGVGMDVVRRNVEALQGSIHIRTVLGKGTTFTIRLPLTLAIMDGLVIGLGDDVYVLPILSVVESFRPRREDLHTVAGRGEVVAVRGETVPVRRLHQLLGRPARVTDPCRGLFVLVEDEGKPYALLVDELLGQMQAVVKSLDANYQRVEGIAGATILGDGRVAMILDIHGLTRLRAGGGVPTDWAEPALA